MPARLHVVAALAVAALALAACADSPERNSTEARPEKVYRTGSNIPVHDGDRGAVTDARVDDTPLHATMPRPPASGR